MKGKIYKLKVSQLLKTLIDRYKNYLEGFTLIELMIVVVLVGVVAGFGIPTYTKIIRKSNERSAILGVITIAKANEVYEVTNPDYLPGNNLNLAAINAGLSIDLKSLGINYRYFGPTVPSPNTFRAQGGSPGPPPFTVRATEGPISIAGGNPCCAPGPACPTLVFCP